MARQKMSNKTFLCIWVPILAILLATIIAVTCVMNAYSVTLDNFLGRGERHVTNVEGTETWDLEFNKPKYATTEEALKAATEVSRRVGNEGFVLLKNGGTSSSQEILPLKEGSAVTPFGYRYLNPVYSVLGSGAVYDGMYDYTCSNPESETMESAIASNFEVNEEIVAKMRGATAEQVGEAPGTTPCQTIPYINACSGSNTFLTEYNASIYASAAASCEDTTGLVFIGRDAGEGGDLKLDAYADDKEVLLRLEQIKHANKLTFAKWAKKNQGVILNTDAIFDVQVKRLHEYKRQLLNAMHIIHLYLQLRDNPNMDMRPHTFLFGAKAAPGYAVAKRIIRLINSMANQINSDPVCKDRLQVFFLENYRVSMAEVLMPASEVSQQISTAGKEASGTGNMKFMMNGALTVGTLDGANVEMHEVLGDENMFLFGLKTEEVKEMRDTGYNPYRLYSRDPALHRVLDQISNGFKDGIRYDDLVERLLFGSGSPADEYMLLADFASYCAAERRMVETYGDRETWNRMSLHNIARSGIFAADRSIADYADTIWHVPYKK